MSTTGEIERSGLVAGTYSNNISTLNNNQRHSVPPALAQISKFSLTGTLALSWRRDFFCDCKW